MAVLVPAAKLGGVPLSCERGQSHSWAFVAGVQPYVGEFLLSRHRAELILSRGGAQLSSELQSPLKSGRRGDRSSPKGPLTFTLEAPGLKPLVVKGLYVTALKAGVDLNTWTVQVSDRRWLWGLIHVERSYNLRRTSGQTRWNGEELVPLQAAEVVADLTHRRASLIGGVRAWTAIEVLEDVLAELCGQGGYVIEASARKAARVPIQDLELSDPGPQALQRVLAHLPGVTVCPDAKGRIRAFSTLDMSEVKAAKSAGRVIDGSGFWRVVDRSLVRPELVRVFMLREHEIRFDHDPDKSYPRGKQPPLLENVIQVPDAKFTLADGREVAAGSWITFREFYAALALGTNVSSNGAGANPRPYPNGVTEDLVRTFSLAGLNYISRLFVYYLGTFDQLWAQRFSAIGRHWRRSFRIAPQWADRMRTLRARRAVLTDAETGRRAPAPVFTDYVLKPHLKTLAPKGASNRAFEIRGWAADLSGATPAPAVVNVVDEGAGVIQIQPRSDLFGVYEEIQLGRLAGEAPRSTAGDLRALWVGSAGGSPVTLTADLKLSVIMSTTPASPNNEGRLHAEEVRLSDAASLLGVDSPGSSRGPVVETKTGLESARYAWSDDRRQQILDAVFEGGTVPAELLSNPQGVRDVARAQAARVVSHLLDRAEGSFEVTLNPEVEPTGNLRSVVHTFRLDGDGKATYTTRLSMPPAAADVRVDSLLPESTRRILLKLVDA